MVNEPLSERIENQAYQLAVFVGCARQLVSQMQTNGPAWLCERLESVHAELVEAQDQLIKAFVDTHVSESGLFREEATVGA